MVHINIFTFVALICVVTNALPIGNDNAETSSEPIINYRLPNATVPIHYDLKFIIDIADTSTYDGEVVVKFKVLEPISELKLHSKDLTLNENATRLISEDGRTFTPLWYSENNVTDILKMYLGDPLEVGSYTLNLQFSGDLRNDLDGLYKSYYVNNQSEKIWYAMTQFEPMSARSAFPCWDELALKATFDISIKHYPNYTALSNMPVSKKSEVDEADGKMWTHFQRTPVMSTYLVAFIVSDFDNITNEDGTISAWSRKDMVPHLTLGFDVAQKAARELELYTNSTDRVPKMDHVTVPKHITAMENWGLITYPERDFVYREDTDTYDRKFSVVTTVIHELAHQWFGNVVSPTWWTHLWLNEGFATYFENYILDKVFKNWRAMDFFVVRILQDSLNTDIREHWHAIDENITTPDQIEEAFSKVVYNKAASILHMLSNIISSQVFRSGLMDYLNEHEYDSADPDCLWKAWQIALDESEVPHDDFKVKEVMDTWIKQRRHPIVYVNRDYSTGMVTLMQKDFGKVDVHHHVNKKMYEDENEEHEWWVPINYATETNPDFSNTRPTHWLKPKKNLTIDGINPDDWIIINKQQSGYYKVTYDNANWEKIAAYLKSENFTKIHVLNRAQIINDVTQLILYKQIDPSVFLDVVTYLSQETDYIPWFPMLNYLKDIKTLLDHPSASLIKELILNVMENLIKDVGGFEQPSDDDLLTVHKKLLTLDMACYLGHFGCLQAAFEKSTDLVETSEENKTTEDLKKLVNTYGMRLINESFWDNIFEFDPETSKAEVLEYLSAVHNSTLFSKYLNKVTSDYTITWDDFKELISNSTLSSHVEIVLDYVIGHWEEFNNTVSSDDLDSYDILINLRTSEQIRKVKKICELMKNEECTMSKNIDKKLKMIRKNENAINMWTKLIKSKYF